MADRCFLCGDCTLNAMYQSLLLSSSKTLFRCTLWKIGDLIGQKSIMKFFNDFPMLGVQEPKSSGKEQLLNTPIFYKFATIFYAFIYNYPTHGTPWLYSTVKSLLCILHKVQGVTFSQIYTTTSCGIFNSCLLGENIIMKYYEMKSNWPKNLK